MRPHGHVTPQCDPHIVLQCEALALLVRSRKLPSLLLPCILDRLQLLWDELTEWGPEQVAEYSESYSDGRRGESSSQHSRFIGNRVRSRQFMPKLSFENLQHVEADRLAFLCRGVPYQLSRRLIWHTVAQRSKSVLRVDAGSWEEIPSCSMHAGLDDECAACSAPADFNQLCLGMPFWK